MAHEYSWETASTYTPPRRDGLGWYALVAVILALLIHVAALIAASSTFYRAEIAAPKEWVSQPVRLTSVETEAELISVPPPKRS
ncbi:hypothetical protein N9594_01330 [bacterium]|nr:hypothetical protein [bacterium]